MEYPVTKVFSNVMVNLHCQWDYVTIGKISEAHLSVCDGLSIDNSITRVLT